MAHAERERPSLSPTVYWRLGPGEQVQVFSHRLGFLDRFSSWPHKLWIPNNILPLSMCGLPNTRWLVTTSYTEGIPKALNWPSFDSGFDSNYICDTISCLQPSLHLLQAAASEFGTVLMLSSLTTHLLFVWFARIGFWFFVAPTHLKHTPICLWILSAAIKGMCHHTQSHDLGSEIKRIIDLERAIQENDWGSAWKTSIDQEDLLRKSHGGI